MVPFPFFHSALKLLRNPKQVRIKKGFPPFLPPPFWTIQKFVIPPLFPRANRPNLAAEKGEKSRLMPLPSFLSAIPETVVYSSGKVGLAWRTLGGRVDLWIDLFYFPCYYTGESGVRVGLWRMGQGGGRRIYGLAAGGETRRGSQNRHIVAKPRSWNAGCCCCFFCMTTVELLPRKAKVKVFGQLQKMFLSLIFFLNWVNHEFTEKKERR